MYFPTTGDRQTFSCLIEETLVMCADHAELVAQVRTTATHHQGQPAQPEEDAAHLQLPRDTVHRRHCLSERRGECDIINIVQ